MSAHTGGKPEVPGQFPDINSALSHLAGGELSSKECAREPLGGGCISNVQAISHPRIGKILYKENRNVPRTFFAAEAQGLRLLAEHRVEGIHIPRVYAVLPHGILMEFLSHMPSSAQLSENFGRALASFHKKSAAQPPRLSNRRMGEQASSADQPPRAAADQPLYGLDHNNYLGLTVQLNQCSENWVTFFTEQRLACQLEDAEKKFSIPPHVSRNIRQLMKRLGDFIPERPPSSLLHGDLWGGNYVTIMLSASPCTALIDPAVYWGHHEAELAMTELFGGFDHCFYQGYADIISFEKEYEIRKEIYNLYHLLNHLNLFGTGYISSITASLQKIMRLPG